ncbi:hypothetical protein L218DRAFT_667200 [Marasmius fiardii PR-910]|nr:hypothetical protein L218DRAFT_667200 [Marasmius fiardii PR-910]
MGSEDSAGERRKSARQVRSTKKRVESGKPKDGESSVRVSGKESQIIEKEDTISQRNTPESSYGWQHPAELDYITPDDWSDTKIIYHLIAYAFDIPPKSSKNGHSFCQIVRMDGTKTVLPHGYRLPLMFLARFQWDSLNLVLSASNRRVEWKEYKFGILHISRLCKSLLDSAQAALSTVEWDFESVPSAKSKNAIRKWRCPTFDRALVRYWFRWFISNPAEVKDFWTEYGETEYEKDVITLNWRQWAVKGHKGFSLAEEEIQNGISAQQIMQGLEEKDGKWYWSTPAIDGGTDAWSLKDKALAVMPSFDNAQNPSPVSCQPLSSKTSLSVVPSSHNTPSPPPVSSITTPSANVPSFSNKPLDTSLTPDVHQSQPPSTPTPVLTSKSTTSLDDNMQTFNSHAARLPTDTTHNGDPDSSSAPAQEVPGSGDDEVLNRSAGGKRPGSPLEKEGPAKRNIKSSLSHVDCTSTVSGSEISNPEHIPELVLSPLTPIIPSSSIQLQRELKPMDLESSSQRDDDNMSIDSNHPVEEPTQPSSPSMERPTSNAYYINRPSIATDVESDDTLV